MIPQTLLIFFLWVHVSCLYEWGILDKNMNAETLMMSSSMIHWQ